LTSKEGFLSHYQVINFLETVAERFDCQHFGFLVGKHQAPLQLGPVAQVVRLSPNVQSALQNGIHYTKLYGQIAEHKIVIEDGYAIVIRRDRKPFPGSAAQLHTLGLVQIFKLLKALCGEHWLPTSVSFAHAAPREKQRYLRFFNCPVGFDREFDGMFFPESDLARPIETANAELLDIVCAHLDTLLAHEEQEGDVVNWVRNYINRKIGTNLCSLESCAQFFDMHPRALQRALSSHDATFKQLLSDIRMELAEHYLQNSAIALTDLTEMLGYRNLSAFSRAFKNSHGESPEQWKKNMELRHK
jgi:AraC-like DNA-binding protein